MQKLEFIKQHNLHCISVQGEQASADIISVCGFLHDFETVMNSYEQEHHIAAPQLCAVTTHGSESKMSLISNFL